jgi:hypothetical protein
MRAYYQIWGLMKLEPEKWASRLQPMKLKRLYQLYEMSQVQQPMGFDEPGAYYGKPGRAILFIRSEKRFDLESAIWEHTKSAYERAHNTDDVCAHPSFNKESGGWTVNIFIWDHWQPQFESTVGRLYPGNPPWPPCGKEALWDDSTDEEL